MKNIVVLLFILSIAVSACSAPGSPAPSATVNPTTVLEPIPTVTETIPSTDTPLVDDKWKVINSIATEDKPVEVHNATEYWQMALTSGVPFSSELQIRFNMKPKADAGIILTGAQGVGSEDQWWLGTKLLRLSYEDGYFNIVLLDGIQEEPVYNNSIPMPLHDGATGEITVTFGRQGRYIRIERDDKTLDRIIASDFGDLSGGLFPENKILGVFLWSAAKSSVQLTEMEFLIPAYDVNVATAPLIPAELKAPATSGGIVAIASWGELILLNHPGSGKTIPETQVDSMNTARFWTGTENERLILESDFIPRNLAWSPNGAHLTFSNLDRQGTDVEYSPYGLYEYDFSTNPATLRLLVDRSIKVSKFAWSPDSQSLAYTKTDVSGVSHLFIASSPNYSNERQVTDYTVYDFTWSPDGNQLAIVASPPTRTNEVRTGYILNPGDSTLTQLTVAPYKYVWNPRWSPDRKYIAFVNGYTKEGSRYLVSDIVYEVSTLSLFKEFTNEWVYWSPKGSHAIRSSLVSILLSDADLGNEQTIYDFRDKPSDFFIGDPNWSPDGQYAAYDLELFDENRTYNLHTLDLNGLTKELANRPEFGRYNEWAYAFTWSPDSKNILFAKYENEQYNLYTADPQSGDINLFAQDLNDVVLEIAWQP